MTSTRAFASSVLLPSAGPHQQALLWTPWDRSSADLMKGHAFSQEGLTPQAPGLSGGWRGALGTASRSPRLAHPQLSPHSGGGVPGPHWLLKASPPFKDISWVSLLLQRF